MSSNIPTATSAVLLNQSLSNISKTFSEIYQEYYQPIQNSVLFTTPGPGCFSVLNSLVLTTTNGISINIFIDFLGYIFPFLFPVI